MMTADATATRFLLELHVYWYAILPQVRDQLSDIFTGPREARHVIVVGTRATKLLVYLCATSLPTTVAGNNVA